MRSMVVATAGHVDHGKTSLIAALTGITTSRLKEEKQRGLTIVNGYAFLRRQEDWIHVLDVPGHERFIKNMLCGLDSVDLALLVVAGDESVMPQTREHLAIVRLLGIQRLIAVMTKADRADETVRELVVEEIHELLEDTPYAGAKVFEVDSLSGEGIEELKDELFLELERHTQRPGFYPRIALDRYFTQKGAGDIVTGTLEGGSLRRGDSLSLYPGGEVFRIRGLQVHSGEREEVGPDNRVALQLSGRENASLERGDILATKDAYAISDQMLVQVEKILPVEGDRRLSIYFGSRELKGKLRFFSEEGALLQLEESTLVYFRQRAIVRSETPALTLGSVSVLDPLPPRGRRNQKERMLRLLEAKTLSEQVELILEKYPWGISEKELEKERTLRFEALSESLKLEKIGGRYFSVTSKTRALREIIEKVERFFAAHPLRLFVSREELRSRFFSRWPKEPLDALLARLQEEGVLRLEGSRLYLNAHVPVLTEQEEKWKTELLALFEETQRQPIEKSEILSEEPRKAPVLQYLAESDEILYINDEFLLKKSWLNCVVNDIITAIREIGPMEIADFRERLHMSRKYLLPLLEYTDAQQITQRLDNRRILAKETANGSDFNRR